MNIAVAKSPPQQSASLIQVMAANYNMDPVAYSNAVKKTAMPGTATNEEFAAFMMVAFEYKLNPLLKEIYAFPKKGGGIVPMVSVDGWVNLINSHPKLSGFSFEMQHDDKGNLVACTCTMQRTDRTMPTVVTEYLSECIRNTDPWKMKYRMLRHKALIQAARYCFGLSGIHDEDEARDVAMRDVTPPPRPKATDFVVPARTETITEDGEIIDGEAQPPAAADHASTAQGDAKPEEGGASSQPSSGDDRTTRQLAVDVGYQHAKEGRSVRAMPAEYRSSDELREAYENGFASFQGEQS